MKKSIAILFSLALALATASALAQTVPQLINYQGRLTDSSSQSLPDGSTVDIAFAFYGAESGATPLYLTVIQENVAVTDGIYHLLIGSGPINPGTETTLAAVFQNHAEVWMGVKIDADPEMTPRARVASSPFALKADQAETATTAASATTADSASDLACVDCVAAAEVQFNYAGSASEGGPATSALDLACTNCVAAAEVQFNYAGSASEGGPATDSDQLDAQHGAFYRDATNLNAGALGNAYFSAYSDLGAESYLNNDADADLLTRIQADGRYVNEGQANSIAAGMVAFNYAGSASEGGAASSVADNAITTAKILNGAILGEDVATDAFGLAQIQDLFVLNTGDTINGILNIVASAAGTIPIQAAGPLAGGYFHDSDQAGWAYVGFSTYKVFGNGTVNFVQNHPEQKDRVIVYTAPEGDETATYTRGKARLQNGVARVPLGETFKWVTNPDLGLTAHVTPRSPNAVLYVDSVSTTELVVKAVQGFAQDADFDYIVYGLRIGFEQTGVVQEKTLEANIPSMKPHRDRKTRLDDRNAQDRYLRMEEQTRPGQAPVRLERAEKLKAAIGEHEAKKE